MNYTYKNLFFEEFWLKFPPYITLLTDKYFIAVLPKGDQHGIALYERFVSPYVKDFASLQTSHTSVLLNHVLGTFLSEDKNSINLVGLDKHVEGQLSCSNYIFKDPKIIIKRPINFIEEKLQFKLDFFNGKSIKFVFNLISTKSNDPRETQKRSGLMVFLVGLMILLILLILGNLLILVLMLKNQRHDEMDSSMLSESSIMEESFRVTNIRNIE